MSIRRRKSWQQMTLLGRHGHRPSWRKAPSTQMYGDRTLVVAGAKARKRVAVQEKGVPLSHFGQ